MTDLTSTQPEPLDLDNLPGVNNLDDLIALLRRVDNSESSLMGFDMHCSDDCADDTSHPCGSAACIGGWVNLANATFGHPLAESVSKLGVSKIRAYELCYPEERNVYKAYFASPAQAIRCIEILRDEGVVDWKRAMAEVPA